MAIELVTGLPGHGKTLITIARYRDIAQKTGRAVFQSGIKELKLPWPEWDPKRWDELEPNSILIVDEAQFLFPVRGRGQPEEWIERLAVHRHKGIDLVLITQNPMLIDSFVRRLVDRHWHIVRKFGTHSVTMHEFPNGVKENVAQSREGSIRHEMRYPKDVFELYKSAEVHTVKRRIPARVYMLAAVPLVVGGLLWYGYERLKPDAVAERVSGEPAPPGGQGSVFGQAQPGRAAESPRPDYFASHTPRVPDLAHTAPVYDEVTRPVQAPYPAACVSMGSRCDCYTQQGTRLQVGLDLCRSIVAGGYFVAWQQPVSLSQAAPAQAAPAASSAR